MNRREFLTIAGVAGLGTVISRGAPRSAIAAEPFSWSSSNLTFSFDVFEDHLRLKHCVPSHMADQFEPPASLHSDTWSLEVAIQCSGEDCADHHGMKFAGGMPGGRLIFADKREEATPQGKRLVLVHKDPVLGLHVESFYDCMDEIPITRRYTRMTNTAARPVGVEYVSSAMLANIAQSQNFENELRIHVAYNSWQAEGQWHVFKPSQLGFVQNGEFSVSGVFASSLGTWSTERYLTMAMVENTALGLTWFWDIEHNGSWHWELSDTSAKATYVYIGGPDEQHSHAWKNLAPGETYQTVPAVVGCVEGGFAESVEHLALYRRKTSVSVGQPRNIACPVIFNDAIALNLDPTADKELPLIDAAAEVGCEYFVIDAGWYAQFNESWWGSVGVWEPSRTRWPSGIKTVLDRIRQKGMIPGLWLEPEVIGMNSPLKSRPDDWFFMRHRRRVIDHDRYLLDFRNPAVRSYIEGVIKRLVEEYGVEYIKWDYNVDGLEGTDLNADSPGQGLLEHNRALLGVLDGVLAKYPQVTIENCASGGGRMDYAMLSRLHIESSSDQGDYRLYPAITTGCSAAVLPEQLGIWSYPQKDSTADKASFNMVNAMLSRIHQSGDLAALGGAAFAQVTTGIQIYKQTIRSHIPATIPSFPLGLPEMTDTKSPVCLAMKAPNATFVAVWRLTGEETVNVPVILSNARLLYPADLGIKLEIDRATLRLDFPRPYMACIIAGEAVS